MKVLFKQWLWFNKTTLFLFDTATVVWSNIGRGYLCVGSSQVGAIMTVHDPVCLP